MFASIGRYFHRKAQRRVRDVGARRAAAQLRKQGIPHRLAVVLIAWRPIPTLRRRVTGGPYIVTQLGR